MWGGRWLAILVVLPAFALSALNIVLQLTDENAVDLYTGNACNKAEFPDVPCLPRYFKLISFSAVVGFGLLLDGSLNCLWPLFNCLVRPQPLVQAVGGAESSRGPRDSLLGPGRKGVGSREWQQGGLGGGVGGAAREDAPLDDGSRFSFTGGSAVSTRLISDE